MEHSNESLEKKQKLILEYYNLIEELKKEKSAIGAKIKKADERFRALLMADADPSQLKLFENIDQFLTDIAA